MTENPAPKAPTGLAARGRSFWRATTTEFDLTDAELVVLAEVCRTLDSLDLLDAMVRKLGPTVLGSTGQPVVNPAMTEARGQRAILHRLIAALALPDESEATMPSTVSMRGRAAARARWRGHHKDAG